MHDVMLVTLAVVVIGNPIMDKVVMRHTLDLAIHPFERQGTELDCVETEFFRDPFGVMARYLKPTYGILGWFATE
jgi:hypothetical protein